MDKKYFRPAEVDLLVGDASKARLKLGWKPRHSLNDIVRDMVLSDLHIMQRDKYLRAGGFSTMNYFE